MPTLWRTRRTLTLAAALAVAAAVPAPADPPADQADQNRRQLEQIRQDPERWARLRHDFQAFMALPPEEQERLRQLDRDLHEQNPATYARLRRAMDRYFEWYQRLPEADRQSIASAPDARERLRRVKEIRARQWYERLPKAYRDRLDQARGEEREALVRKYHDEERKRDQQWQLARSQWEEMMTRGPRRPFVDPQVYTEAWVQTKLAPRLNPAERTRLQKAGKGPPYFRTVVELADKYLPSLPGPLDGPKHFNELPKDVQEGLDALKPSARQELNRAEGKWPDYAIRVTEVAERNGIRLPKQLGPCRPEDLPPSVHVFVHLLDRRLTPEERLRLKQAEGRWPLYPQTLTELARRHGLFVPDSPLPGPGEWWEPFRSRVGSAGTPAGRE